MKSASERYGVIFTRQRVGNSKGNSQIEFGQRLLQMIGMDYPEFLGMGVRTKSKYSRKSDDVINEQIKPKNQPSREYVIESIIKVVTEFNNTSFDGELTPNQKFDTSDKPYAIKLEPYQIADLFWKSRRVTISKGRIKITNRKQDYYFLLNNADRIKYDGSEVVVRYDERDMSEGIYAFTTNELPAFLFKADIQPGFRMAKVEQTEEDSEAISKIWKHNREWRKMIDAKVENSSKEALEQIQLKVSWLIGEIHQNRSLKRRKRMLQWPGM